jgi:hypothetical protein
VDEHEDGAAIHRSKILIALGLWFIAAAVYALFIPAAPDASPTEHRLYIMAASAFWLAVGLGLLFHRAWAMWLYSAGAIVGFAIIVSTSVGTFSERSVLAAIMAIALGIPALLIWIRRNRLRPAQWRGSDA